ncbi:uncharacterized protein BP01DRAFT_217976 [Aspergillus saccharolyticus JOP 1030-1]|uniref:Uncharacterized protein n=1 Tax=Aspergillus saccharolyticus JOP 1030-1 TaxID=1450539 RepID=A0A318ZT45_9EURO|nr:hypothetical protein BP01DRAFT_217976 [Aspergillus saccharolyticus JOP 1030-1]PYH47533.1 hypothetical protein BP01DRAFT_217976 [Aspergillus saccharolyticus JOP 1030-1]
MTKSGYIGCRVGIPSTAQPSGLPSMQGQGVARHKRRQDDSTPRTRKQTGRRKSVQPECHLIHIGGGKQAVCSLDEMRPRRLVRRLGSSFAWMAETRTSACAPRASSSIQDWKAALSSQKLYSVATRSYDHESRPCPTTIGSAESHPAAVSVNNCAASLMPPTPG